MQILRDMKNNLLIIFILGSVLVSAQIINIPDPTFKALLLAADVGLDTAGLIRVDINNNGEIEQSEALLVQSMNIPNANISSIVGLEYFTNVDAIAFFGNNISTINVSTLTRLRLLGVSNNPLTSITLTGAVALQRLACGGSLLTQIDFSGLPNLKAVSCNFSRLTSLDFSNNPLFNELGCRNNNLTSINIKNGRTQSFAQSNILYTDCWATGNPNLTVICADANEVASLQTFLTNCGTTQAINIVSNCALDNESFSENKIMLLPNPTKDLVYFDNSKTAFELVTMHNSLGQQVLNQRLTVSGNEMISLQNLPLGIYFFKFIKGKEIKTLKVVKE